ncbi:MAG: ABC transporter ATP-binding protein [Caldisericia bacterium]|nr:ABC transporter ATP-binding protein [Caldisericia bacterium]
MEEIILMKDIKKRFPGVNANDGITFYAKKGEIVALLGENGAGKTTLMKILYGLYRKDSGEIFIKGKKVEISSPKDAINQGIGMVHQHFTLVNPFTVTENIILGLDSNGFKLDIKKAKEKVLEYMKKYELFVDPDAKISELSVGEKQKVEILKVLFRNIDILILDEPTAVLTPQEVKELFKTLKILKNENKTIIFISHKLDEVLEISDRIVILRNGKVAGERDPKNTNKRELASLMVGKEVFDIFELSYTGYKDIVLKIENLKVLSDRGHIALKNLNFEIKRGEIVGLAGVSGNGQKELEEVISGVRFPIEGKIFYKGYDITYLTPKERINRGMGRIPEDRMEMGLVLDLPVFENLIIEYFDKNPFSKGVFLNYKEIFYYCDNLIKKFDIRTPNQIVTTKKLSGGNLQKCILARILSMNPDFVLASQPTRGLDVGATEFIHKQLIELREKGAGILLISEDLDEILNLSDRILVIYNGEIMGEVLRGELTREEIGLMMTGTKKEELHAIT